MEGDKSRPAEGRRTRLEGRLDLVGPTLAAAIVGVMSLLGVYLTTLQLDREAHQQYQSDLVLRALEPDDLDEREAQLRFLLETRLLTDEEIRSGLDAYLEGPDDLPQFARTGCHSSYEPCVPIVADVDCAGEGDDGPTYTGEVTVVGPDVYALDGDGDGTACEGSAGPPQPTPTS